MSVPPPPPAGFEQAPTIDENLWSALCHALALATGFIGVPGFVAPLVILFTQAKKSTRVRINAVEALNFQLNLLCIQVIFIAAIFAAIIDLNELSATKLVSVIAILLVVGIALGLYTLVMPIIAAVRTSNGENYRYPLTLRLVK